MKITILLLCLALVGCEKLCKNQIEVATKEATERLHRDEIFEKWDVLTQEEKFTYFKVVFSDSDPCWKELQFLRQEYHDLMEQPYIVHKQCVDVAVEVRSVKELLLKCEMEVIELTR